MKIYIVIPTHNEQKHILNVVKEVSKYGLPVVVVDDGSKDGTSKKLIKTKIPKLKILTHRVNLGKGAAMKTGAQFAFGQSAEAVIFMDSDGQHKAQDLPQFISKLKSKRYEIVFGSRNFSMGVPLIRYLGNKVASVTAAILFGKYVSDSLCGFRALTKKGYQKVKWESSGYGVEIEMVARAGKYDARFTEVPVETVYIDKVKGVTLLDTFGILFQVVKWRLTL